MASSRADHVRGAIGDRKEYQVNQPSITLFLDIDGVLNISNPSTVALLLNDKMIWPIPMTVPFLNAIEQDAYVIPVWMSHWGEDAHAWNDFAGTKHWDIGYPLTLSDETNAKRLYPLLDGKTLAVQYYLHFHPTSHAVWMQDGFPTVPPLWPEQNNAALIDATREPLHGLLLSSDTNAERLLSMILSVAKETHV